jgi:hypothetical protein
MLLQLGGLYHEEISEMSTVSSVQCKLIFTGRRERQRRGKTEGRGGRRRRRRRRRRNRIVTKTLIMEHEVQNLFNTKARLFDITPRAFNPVYTIYFHKSIFSYVLLGLPSYRFPKLFLTNTSLVAPIRPVHIQPEVTLLVSLN